MTDLTMEALRAEGMHHHDPVRFHYLEVLATRLPLQPQAVQQVLARRLHQAVADYAKSAQSTSRPSPSTTMTAPAAQSPLAQLNRDLSAQSKADSDSALTSDGANLSDMKSVRRFSEVWSKISAEQQVVQALQRGPENAGPLNSHRLMLRSLSLMRTLSPDYLQRLLSQMDSLLWLEQANNKPSSLAAKPARRLRSKP